MRESQAARDSLWASQKNYGSPQLGCANLLSTKMLAFQEASSGFMSNGWMRSIPGKIFQKRTDLSQSSGGWSHGSRWPAPPFRKAACLLTHRPTHTHMRPTVYHHRQTIWKERRNQKVFLCFLFWFVFNEWRSRTLRAKLMTHIFSILSQ